MIKKKSILITGGYGFLGTNIFKNLKKKNKVIRIGKFKKKKIITFKNLKRLNIHFDIIIHCAGGSSVINSIEYPKQDYDKTVGSIKAVIRFIKLHNNQVKLIYISSPAIYGNSIKKKLFRPISPYGKNKLIAEKLLTKFVKKNKCKLIIIRFFSLYGDGLKKQLLWDILTKLKKKIHNFHGTGEEKRLWMHVQDAVNVIKLSIIHSKKKVEIINAAGGDILKNKAVIKLVYKLLKINKKPLFSGISRKGDPSILSLKNKELKKIGWKSSISFSSGLNNYIKWFKKK